MIRFVGRAILLDVEGTTSSIRYVYDVLFPFARAELDSYLERHWRSSSVVRACEQIAGDAGAKSLGEWVGPNATEEQARAKVRAEVLRLMDGDVKATGLKELQGLIWAGGYHDGRLQSHLYPDVAPALQRWSGAGMDLRIFSSGSVGAQHVFFAHTEAGNLLELFRGHYDTTTGPKREPASYRAIAADMAIPTGQILFLSDVTQELDAAVSACMKVGLVVRPGNHPVPEGHGHPVVTDFDQIAIG